MFFLYIGVHFREYLQYHFLGVIPVIAVDNPQHYTLVREVRITDDKVPEPCPVFPHVIDLHFAARKSRIEGDEIVSNGFSPFP